MDQCFHPVFRFDEASAVRFDVFTKTMRIIHLIQILPIALLLNQGCAESWQMDYGKPAAQFLEKDLSTKGTSFVGKKITVKGTVARVDLSDPKSARVHLTSGIDCNFGEFREMAKSFKPGDSIHVDGFLKKCEASGVIIDPAMSRDPKAPFAPR